MKSRARIYERETKELLRLITNYHVLKLEQLKYFFPDKDEIIKSLINILLKQGRITLDKEKNIVTASNKDIENIDYGMIAAIWILLDFKSAIDYHNVSDYPAKLCFFASDELYEIFFIGEGQEHLMNHAISAYTAKDKTNLLLIVEDKSQIQNLRIPNVLAFCMVSEIGEVNYYGKK